MKDWEKKKKTTSRQKKLSFEVFICKERPVPLKQTFLTLQIQKTSLWPEATLHIVIFERKGEGDKFTSRKWLPGVSLPQCTT